MILYAHSSEHTHRVLISEEKHISDLCHLIGDSASLECVRVGKFPKGPAINPTVLVSTFFSDLDDVYIISSEERKETPEKRVVDALKYLSLNSYSFYESGKWLVKVDIPFKGIKQHPKEEIKCQFHENSFILCIQNFQGKHYQFSVPRLQCGIQSEKCKFSVMNDRLRVTLYKHAENDNWFSLFKAKTIGGED